MIIYVENAKQSTKKATRQTSRRELSGVMPWWLHDCSFVWVHWIVFLKLRQHPIICKLHHNKADQTGTHTCTPTPHRLQPHSSCSLGKHNTLFITEILHELWFHHLKGEFLNRKSEKALEKDILSNTGMKQLPMRSDKVIRILPRLIRQSFIKRMWR